VLMFTNFETKDNPLRAVIAQSVERLATGWMIDVLGFDSRRELGIFLYTTASRTALVPTQPPILLVRGGSFPAVKPEGVKLTTHLHLVPRSKNLWIYTSSPQYVFMVWCLV
jgi:hypothetical protein